MLTDRDVRRIVDGTGMPLESFVRFAAGDDIRLERGSPWWVRLADRRAVMALEWRRGHCIFLGADDRCGIYEHRPVTCRSHPFNVTLSDTGAVERVSLSRVVRCEYELDGRVTRRELIAVDRWNDRDSGAYQAKVERWNRRRDGDRSERAFLRYLGLLEPAPA